jgi:hypothetical protein
LNIIDPNDVVNIMVELPMTSLKSKKLQKVHVFQPDVVEFSTREHTLQQQACMSIDARAH